MASNERLAALLREAGFMAADGSGRKAFARAVREAAASLGVTKDYNHTYVGRWLNGMVPRDAITRDAIAAALSRRLGRLVNVDEIGFGTAGTVPSDLGLTYPESVSKSIDTLATLWNADLEDVRSVQAANEHVAAWSDASLAWLVSPDHAPQDRATGWKVGLADVQRITTTSELFDRLDGQFGGAHARRSLIQYLREDVATMLRGTYSAEVGKQLYSASAQATLLAAWMSYDSGLHGLAQRYFIQALRLAQESGDRLLAASILDAMSHQATFLGRFREAANMARAARMGTTAVGTPILTAHFYMMEARALARLGEARETDNALSAAVREFERRIPGEGPEWIQYFDDAEMAAEFGHCNRDLGRAVVASTYAEQSLTAASGDYVRSDFFATMVLADSYLDQGQPEQAFEVALRALSIGEQIKSARCALYVEEFRARLVRLGNSPIARDFQEQARTARLWSPNGSER